MEPIIDRNFIPSILPNTTIDREILHGIMAIDAASYAPEFLNPDIHYAWHSKNPEIYTVVIDPKTEKVCGYINAMPIEDSYFEQLITGSVNDAQLPSEKIRCYDEPGFYKMWFCSIVVEPRYRSTVTYRILLNTFIDKMIQLANRGIFISDIYADAVTIDGERMAQFTGMDKKCQSEHGSWIYGTTILSDAFRATTKSGKELQALYKKKLESI